MPIYGPPEHNAHESDARTMTAEEFAVFYTQELDLSEYALACGYQEKYDNGTDSVTLWFDSCYHVRHHSTEHGRIFWDSFEDDDRAGAYDRLRETIAAIENTNPTT